MTSLLTELVDKVLPNLPPRDTRTFLIWRIPQNAPAQDINEALQVISRFQAHAEGNLCLKLQRRTASLRCAGLKEWRQRRRRPQIGYYEIRRNWAFPTPRSAPGRVCRLCHQGRCGHQNFTVKPQKSLLVLVITLMLAFVQRGSVAFLLYAHWFWQLALPLPLCKNRTKPINRSSY